MNLCSWTDDAAYCKAPIGVSVYLTETCIWHLAFGEINVNSNVFRVCVKHSYSLLVVFCREPSLERGVNFLDTRSLVI